MAEFESGCFLDLCPWCLCFGNSGGLAILRPPAGNGKQEPDIVKYYVEKTRLKKIKRQLWKWAIKMSYMLDFLNFQILNILQSAEKCLWNFYQITAVSLRKLLQRWSINSSSKFACNFTTAIKILSYRGLNGWIISKTRMIINYAGARKRACAYFCVKKIKQYISRL